VAKTEERGWWMVVITVRPDAATFWMVSITIAELCASRPLVG
jgi:hypothetical protein